MIGVTFEKKYLQLINDICMKLYFHYYSNHHSPSRQHDPMKECNIILICLSLSA